MLLPWNYYSWDMYFYFEKSKINIYYKIESFRRLI